MNISSRPERAHSRPAPRIASFKSARDFCAAYEPVSYAIEPCVRSSSLYTVTARTGTGKTSFALAVGLAVATGRPDILDREVSFGRVAYVAAENPDDLRMRLLVAAYHLNIDLDELGDQFVVLEYRVSPEELFERLNGLAAQHPFALIIIDTLAAFFDGSDANDNVATGEFLRRLRPLTQIAGKPSVLVPAHPVKNASDDNLVPYGGGAILNEVDGNLTLSPKNGLVSLHWQGKIRGVDFEPIFFRSDMCSSPNVLDAKGREVMLPMFRPASPETCDARQDAANDEGRKLLRVMLEKPGASISDLGAAIGKSKGAVHRKLVDLKKEGLVETVLGKWTLAPKGKRAAK
ncbi:hypothetical protein M2322_003200 [Rhodoblastus acidophilus]|uniref:AAA family ATPase n=1 Tax=Rhodoblastus acidophilus TaxID=1074 RepID=UPI002224A0F4|nr:AAA family ATPase [Rhodoblastus acidophilus]MCW2317636.1 hypothetical protein [Rhodoblastus acidophilus]